MITLGLRGLRHLFLKPWSFQTKVLTSWGTIGPAIDLSFDCENLRFSLGPNHILTCSLIRKRLIERFPEFFCRQESKPIQLGTMFDDIFPENKEEPFKADQHYVDDLRAGERNI